MIRRGGKAISLQHFMNCNNLYLFSNFKWVRFD